MKRLALIVLVAAVFIPQAYAGPWIRSLATAQKKAKDAKALIFVDMFADWCGWCHRMEQEVFPSAAFQNATDKMVLLRLNTEDGAEGTKLAQKFGITTLPTFLVLTDDLTVAGIIRGYAPPNDFVKSLSDVETKYKTFLSLASQEAKFGSGDYDKRLQLAREYHARGNPKDAEPRLRKLIVDPKAPANVRDQAFYELAVLLLEQRRFDEALKTIKDFSKVQSQGEHYERARLLAADVYLAQNNLMGAANELRSFKATFPKSPLMQNVDFILPQIEKQLTAQKR